MPDHHPRRRAMSVGLVAGATYLGLPNVLAQPSSAATWPDRSVRVVVPYAPGGGADVIARTLFAQVAELLGQTFVIENRGGGAGIIGANAVAKAAPDGYTVLHDATALSVNPALFEGRLPFDARRDLRPVFLAGVLPNFLCANLAAPQRSVEEVIALPRPRRAGWTGPRAATAPSSTLRWRCSRG